MFHISVRGVRRPAAATVGLLLGGLLCAAAPAAAASGGGAVAGVAGRGGRGCTTSTTLGRVQGVAEGGTCAYLGVPYAAPPTGSRRFLPPAPAAPWHGTLSATAAKPGCPQDLSVGGGGSEDCLYTQIWQPRSGGAGKPVLVFLHGGADELGSANEPVFDGAALAERGDAVVVSVDYRLGLLGWTELGALDPRYTGSGNNGLRDQIAALTWVRQQIRGFGGNPGDVTVFGQSAGAISISALLAGDHPERLFRRAIVESGPGYLVHTAQYAKDAAAHVLATGGITSVAQLDAMSTEKLLQLQAKAQQGQSGLASALFFGPSIDGALIPGPVVDRIAAGSARHVDVMLGTTENETDYWAMFAPQLLDLPLSAYQSFPAVLAAQKQSMYAQYAADRPALSQGRVVNAMLTDQVMRVPTLRMAQAQARWRPTYVYQFNWHVPYATGVPEAQNLGAMHTEELPFVLGNLDLDAYPRGAATLAAERPQLTKLSQDMMDAWSGFARTGHPGWRSYTPATRATKIWDTPERVQDGPQETERALWDGFGFSAWDLEPWAAP
ncbi:carboxylesterase/lipase family protein [Catenulispora sp. NF23]|uniref:Carboxylic ester hydrolase n=1 Tax=Catenulispora pinistramenti TaxID=2705254 RepID=A0ABS5KTQ8_9ACTN|nr:carboxylesterase family protein [Catenulispora pinistramenti]MBS2533701.1 carboxylesterase/lipase family protein [Catenulispora pinistramenti]MBS2549441.1 carboxylesterase/lipase family protein [Catenulispora pinistramenti]